MMNSNVNSPVGTTQNHSETSFSSPPPPVVQEATPHLPSINGAEVMKRTPTNDGAQSQQENPNVTSTTTATTTAPSQPKQNKQQNGAANTPTDGQNEATKQSSYHHEAQLIDSLHHHHPTAAKNQQLHQPSTHPSTLLTHCLLHKTHLNCTSLDPSQSYEEFLWRVRYLLGECDAEGVSVFDLESEGAVASPQRKPTHQNLFSNEEIMQLWQQLESEQRQNDSSQSATIRFIASPFQYNLWRLKYAILSLYREQNSFTRIAQECFPKSRLLKLMEAKEMEEMLWNEQLQNEWRQEALIVFLEALQKRQAKSSSQEKNSIILANQFTTYLHKEIFTHSLRSFADRFTHITTVDDADWQNIFSTSIAAQLQTLRQLKQNMEQVQQYKRSLLRFMNHAFPAETAGNKSPAQTPISPSTNTNEHALQEAFRQFSKGQDSISFDDFKQGLHQFCGIKTTTETLIVVRDMFNTMDADASGQISMQEFRSYMLEDVDLSTLEKAIIKTSEGNLIQFFHNLTPQQKDTLSFEEFMAGLLQQNVRDHPESLLRRLFVTMDKSALGALTMQDFLIHFQIIQEDIQEKERQKEKAASPSTQKTSTPGGVKPRLIGVKWTKHMDELGNRFYFNHETGKSSWYKPKELREANEKACSWKEFKNAKGISYFYNKKTKESSWVMPPRLKKYLEHLRKNGFEIP